MDEFIDNKKKKNTPFIVMTACFLFLMLISTLIIMNLSNLYNEKKSADIITISEDLHTQIYDTLMSNLSKIFAVKSIVESTNGMVPDYSPLFKEILLNTELLDIIIAPDCEIKQIYPKRASPKLLGKNYITSFPDAINLEDLCLKNTPIIIGPYEKDDYKLALAAVVPYFIQKGSERVFGGLISVSVDFPDILNEIDFTLFSKRDIAFKIWHNNNNNSEPVIILESDIPVTQGLMEYSRTFSKNYFSSTLFYTLTPTKVFFETRIFYVIAICMVLFGVLLSLAAFFIFRGISIEEKEKLFKIQTKLVETQEHTIFSLSNLVEYRDSDTGNHVKRTSNYVELIARKAMAKGLYKEFLTEEYIQILRKAAPMHDIGKITIPDAILKKPGKLTSDEYDIIKKHSVEGGRIVRDILGPVQTEEYTNIATQIATFHHEKWDGSGYPAGLSGEQIPLSARIMAIADVFDALTTPRCYKEVYSFEKTLSIIMEGSGTHFDPQLVKVLVENQEDMRAIMIKFAE